MKSSCKIYIVDDDDAVRESLALLLTAHGKDVQTYSSALDFLDAYQTDIPSVLIVDIRMPQMSGLELQDELLRRDAPIPIIFITGHGDIPMAVSTLQKGASDFLEKPFSERELRQKIDILCAKAEQLIERHRYHTHRKTLLDRLTEREYAVLERISAGRLNKQIADDLGISIKTVEAHRANVMEKLEANTVAELMHIFIPKE